jgi:phosphoglycolate phosphatase-like HAD superfamily hydrolase
MLLTVTRFAILTSNSSDAVHRFLERFPLLEQRLAIVIGRDELGGPKTEFDVFQVGIAKCLSALQQVDKDEQSTYLGDSPYELDFAHRLGLRALNVSELTGSEWRERKR